jgi:deoxyribodipyrimidine photo-lyase
LFRTGSPYAVAPGRVLKPSDATPYKVYTPFYKGWRTHGWRAPAVTPKKFTCVEPTAEYRAFPDFPMPAGVTVIEAGEAAALKRFKEFTNKGLDSYDEKPKLCSYRWNIQDEYISQVWERSIPYIASKSRRKQSA